MCIRDRFTIDDGENFKEGIVHRLDKDTSGIIVITKNLISKNKFREMFKKLADKYLEKTSSVSSPKIANQFSGDRNLKPINKDSHYIATSHLSVKRGHWANRDFSEYRDAA